MKKLLLIASFNILALLPFYAQINDSLVAHYLLNVNGNDEINGNHGTVI